MNRKTMVYDLSLLSVFLSLSLLFKFISSFIKIFNNYPLELEVMFLLIGILLLKNLKFKLLLLLISPLLWIFIYPPFVYNWIQLFVEYFLSIYIFLPLCFIKLNKNKITNLFILIFLLILCFLIKMFIHILSGVIWWTNNDWKVSLFFNLPIVGVNSIINISLTIVVIIPLLKIKNYFTFGNKHSLIQKTMYI